MPSDPTPKPKPSNPGGRPRAADAALIADRIITAASELFLRDGYAATSVEAIATQAGISKRTFYARFPDKPAIFLDVVTTLIQQWLEGFEEAVEHAPNLRAALLTIAHRTLEVALTPNALALHVLLTAEALRFNELSSALHAGGADTATTRVAALLQRHDPGLTPQAAAIAAAQFQGMVLYAPQRRALSAAPPWSEDTRETWCQAAVDTLLGGLASVPARSTPP